MTRTDTLIKPHIPAIVPRLNPLIRRLLGAGLPFGPNVLLTVRGRSTGLARTFPVAMLEVDGRRFIQSPFGEVNWVRNLRADGTAMVAKGDSSESVEAIELTPEAAGPVLRDALAPYLRWRIGAFVIGRYFHVRADSPIEDYIAIARLHPMFELLVRTAN
jgi:deazaflavin-dependent oxidoreductase (nitroreductase family)